LSLLSDIFEHIIVQWLDYAIISDSMEKL